MTHKSVDSEFKYSNQLTRQFQPPRGVPTIEARVTIALLEESSTWLSHLNSLASGHENWSVESVDDTDDWVKLCGERQYLFSVLEVGPKNLDKVLRSIFEARQVLSEASYRYRHALAIVGHPELRQDSRVDTGATVKPNRDIEFVFRAAGVSECCWHNENFHRLARRIELFADSLPEQPVSIEDYIFHHLPWSR